MNYRYGFIPVLMIICCLLISSAITLSAAEDESARIMALGGGAVKGIIPDFYTDFRDNPAVLGGQDRTGVFYRMVDPDPVRLPLFRIDTYWEPIQVNPDYSWPVNAADFFWGGNSSKWKFAVSSILKLSQTEESSPRILYTSSNYETIIEEDNQDIWLLDLTAAYTTENGISLGIRAGGRGSYGMHKYRWLEYSDQYQ